MVRQHQRGQARRARRFRGLKGQEKVLRFDRPLAGGFLGLTGLWPEGCGIAALGGDEYIVSVTGLPLVSPLLHDEEQEGAVKK